MWGASSEKLHRLRGRGKDFAAEKKRQGGRKRVGVTET